MKINVSAQDFRSAVAKASGVIGNTSELPILSNLLLEASGSHLAFLGTNTNQFLRTWVECDVEQEGAIVLSAAWLSGSAKTMQGEKLSLQVDDKLRATMSVPGNVQKQQGLVAAEFLPLPDAEHSLQWIMPQAEMRYALGRVAPAMSDNRTGDVLCGMLLSGDGKEMRFAATNRRMLAVVTEAMAGITCQLVIPADCTNLLARTLTGEGVVTIRAGKNQVAFEMNDTVIVSKLLEGTYPNYQQAIPSPSDYTGGGMLDRQALRSAMATVEPASRVKGATPLAIATFSEGKLSVQAENETTEAHCEIDVETAGDLRVGIDPNKIIKSLSGLDDEAVRLDWCKPNTGLTFTAGNFMAVVMPIRLQPV